MKTFNLYELIFFWFFGEIETCDSPGDLALLRKTYEEALLAVERGGKLPSPIGGYRAFTMPWHKEIMTPMLFKMGMI